MGTATVNKPACQPAHKGRLQRLLERLLGRSGELYYINGPQTLPPPLTREEEAELLERLAIDESARNILVERNLRLVVYTRQL